MKNLTVKFQTLTLPMSLETIFFHNDIFYTSSRIAENTEHLRKWIERGDERWRLK